MVLQEVWRDRIWAARPLTVVDDSDDLLVLWCPLGTLRKIPAPPPHRAAPATRAEHVAIALKNCDWVFVDHRWDVSTLWLIEPGAWHATWVSFQPDGRHLGWYVNFQDPFRRTGRGIVAMDLMLDIVVDGDRGWRWKDQDEFDLVVAEGLYTDATIAAVRREADSVVQQIEARAEPFDDTWLRWKPPADWEIPVLPSGWDRFD